MYLLRLDAFLRDSSSPSQFQEIFFIFLLMYTFLINFREVVSDIPESILRNFFTLQLYGSGHSTIFVGT